MSNKKYVLGVFEHEDDLLNAIRNIRSNGVKIKDVFTPFPVHGIEKALDMKRSNLGVAAFVFGCIGLTAAVSMQSWMLGFDWPMDIGGKPSLAFPSFVPVSFEMTVLFASLGMVATYFYRNRMAPGVTPRIMDIRASDDKFIIAIDLNENSADTIQLDSWLRESGASEVNLKEA